MCTQIPSDADLEAAGLLGDVNGAARTARERLIRELLQDGCTLDELKLAVDQQRLALLPAERFLRRGEVYTAEEIAERAGLPAAALRAQLAALGLPPADEGVACYGPGELELAELIAKGLAAGLDPENVVDFNRVVARGVSSIAAASRVPVMDAAGRSAPDEHKAASAYAGAARDLTPITARLVALAFEAHVRRLLATEFVSAGQIVAGETLGARHVTVGFADLVGFTSLGQSVTAGELAATAARFESLALEAMPSRVSLVKTIGDGLLLVCREPEELIDTMLELVDAVAALQPAFPQARAGIATGVALERAGDWYGDPVNLAHRVTQAAPPNAVVVIEAVRNATASRYRFAPLGAAPLKGVASPPHLFRVLDVAGSSQRHDDRHGSRPPPPVRPLPPHPARRRSG